MTGRKTKTEKVAKSEIEKLLDKQTETILAAVDERFVGADKRFDAIDKRLDGIDRTIIAVESRLERRIERLDLKFTEKFNQIITLLDKISKRLTDFEQELELMKRDLNRVKAVIKEKFGIEV